MTSMVEEFYYTNFNEQARNAPPAEQCDTYTEQARKLQDELLESFDEAQKAIYMKYDALLNDLANMTNRENFVAGFRFGARFALDTFA